SQPQHDMFAPFVYRHKAGCLFLTQLPGNAKQAGKD
ncbi:hypothetical protein ECC1470_23213, partial [Escherichia coli ECC-1470]